MKNILSSCIAALILTGCAPEPQNKHVSYENIVILSDLSSRIDNKPSKDLNEIKKILEYFKNDCVRPGKKMGDKSSIYFSTFSDQDEPHVIDIGSIKDLSKRQQFINSTGEYTNTGLDSAIIAFEEQAKIAYANIKNQGLDLICVLLEKIEHGGLIKESTLFRDGIDTTFVKNNNHIYIFTDGSLAYKNMHINSQFYFGLREVGKVRNYGREHNIDIAAALEKNQALGLPPSSGNKNKYINLHVRETHERDKNDVLQTYKHPKGHRDNEILEAVWKKWAAESGFKSFDWKRY